MYTLSFYTSPENEPRGFPRHMWVDRTPLWSTANKIVRCRCIGEHGSSCARLSTVQEEHDHDMGIADRMAEEPGTNDAR
jgi:hypothetical protein